MGELVRNGGGLPSWAARLGAQALNMEIIK